MQFLEYLRSQPQTTRTQYAFVLALLITFVIGAVWATTLPARFNTLEKQTQHPGEVSKKEQFPADTQIIPTHESVDSQGDVLDQSAQAISALRDVYTSDSIESTTNDPEVSAFPPDEDTNSTAGVQTIEESSVPAAENRAIIQIGTTTSITKSVLVATTSTPQ